ncbi:MAG: abortive infection family protein [Methylococcales bacterium]|nr:abortive infection family protein [Methylococcales bacterium]
MNEGLLEQQPDLKSKAMLALKNAISSEFDAGDWHAIGHLTNCYEYITGHARLLRSLSWGDSDYEACIFQALNYIFESSNDGLKPVIEYEKVKQFLSKKHSDILSSLGYSESRVPSTRTINSATEVVRKALVDAETLLHQRGAVNAIDRLHTALHGYLRSECENAGIVVADDAAITVLFKNLKKHHSTFQNLGTHQLQIIQILQSFSGVIDSLNTLRNHGSLAHPNEFLLDEAEAELTVNAIRTLFNYLVKKLDN